MSLLRFGLLTVFLGSLAASAATPPPREGYTLVFEDNFDGTRLDENAWLYRLGRRGGEANFSGIDGFNRRENVRVADGLLRVRVDQEVLAGRKENTGGGVITRQRFGYGYYECRYRPLMAGNGGVHTAFWQRGVDPVSMGDQTPDPSSARENIIFEIDSSEVDNPHWVGTNNLYDVISPKSMSDGTPWPARFHLPITPQAGGWFVDAYEYTPEGVIFYDNGREVARVRYDRIRGQQNVWLTALNGFGQIKDRSIYPGEVDFDYFRFYARDYPGANLLANEGFEYNLDRIAPQHPIAWAERGDGDASALVRGDAFLAATKLRHSADALAAGTKAYRVTTAQTLQHILNGRYVASAMVRSSGGQRVARFVVRDHGGAEVATDIAAGPEWRRVILPRVEVTAQTATVAIESDADAGQWLEVDDVQFLKPRSESELVVASAVFDAVPDPIWRLLDQPFEFSQGGWVFFGREVGRGEAITVATWVRASRLTDQVVLERMPKQGTSGWGLRLGKDGSAAFRVGSAADFSAVVALRAYRAGEWVHVAAVVAGDTVRVYVGGREAAQRSGITQRTLDRTAAGTLGGVHRTSVSEPFVGTARDVRVYNRALTAAEIAALAQP
jgi:hypothetical protein